MAEWRNIPDDKKAAKYFWLAHEAFSLDASWKLAEMLILNRTEARGPFAEEDLTIPGSNPRLGRLRTAIALIGWIVHRDHIIQPHTRRPDAMEMRASPLMQPDSIMFEHAYTFRSPTKSSLAGTAKKVRTPTNVEDALWQEREEYIRKAMEEAIAMLPEHLRPRSGKETLREKRSDKDDKVSVDLVDQKAGNDREWTEASSQEEDDWDMSIPAGSPPVPEHLRPREERLDTKSVDVFEDEESLAHPFFAPQHEYIYTGSTSEDIGTGSPALPDLQWYKRTTVYFLRNTRLNFLIPMLRVARDLLKEVEAGGAGLLENEDKAIWVDDLNRHRIGDRREKLARKAKTKKLYEENMKKRREKAERTINQDTAKERKKGMTNAEEVVMEDFWAQLKAVRAGVSLKDTPATQTTMEPNISDKSNAPQSWWTDSSKAAALQNIPSTLTSSERAKISQDFALSQDELRDKDRQGVSLRSLQIAFENSHSENADGEQVTTSQTSAGRDGSALLRWAAQQRETISGQQEDTETPPLTGETKAPEPQGRGEDSGWFDVAAPVDNWPDGRTKGNEGSSEK
ncbi:hypothetical protein DACRYDRAFT_21908 [Dacryopinax primogenitus]|uniref:Uncharacterized protein n=1 Tax=Dacryopinax primogenitus (strain DJM 731) TaxID=1858805 RepID=M5FW99_DACPD|nr:uncharacterized protein DACRYDRAFT_21908 [Dacryopinax primogenitus]EJU02161.1 hypothetical protein DACRYDRAFT_21908 [Dacryopinax primogenitus]